MDIRFVYLSSPFVTPANENMMVSQNQVSQNQRKSCTQLQKDGRDKVIVRHHYPAYHHITYGVPIWRSDFQRQNQSRLQPLDPRSLSGQGGQRIDGNSMPWWSDTPRVNRAPSFAKPSGR